MLPIVRTQDGAQESEQAVATALDELAREGVRRMILAALEVEAEEYRQRHRDARDPRGHALVFRNGQARPRRLTVGTGTITIRAPRVNERRRVDEVRHKFISRILPPYLRRSPQVSAVPPALSSWPVHRGFPRGPTGAAGGRRGGALARRDHAPDDHLADRVRSAAARNHRPLLSYREPARPSVKTDSTCCWG